MTDTGEKFRAIFFAAIMVISMVGMTAAFAGGAAAANAPPDGDITLDGEDSIEIQANSDEEVDIEFTATNLNNVDSDQTVTFSLDLRGDDANAEFTSISNVQVVEDGTDNNIGTDDESVVVSDEDPNQITFDVLHDAGSYDVDVTIEDATIEAGELNSADLFLDIVDDGGDNDEVTQAGAVNVVEQAPYLELSNLDPEKITAEEGGTFDVSVDVENTGQQDTDGTSEITLEGFDAIDGDETEEVELSSGETETVTFENVAVNDDASGDTGELYNFDIVSGDDTISGTLLVGDSIEGSLSVEVRGDFDPDIDEDPVNVALFQSGADTTDISEAVRVGDTGDDRVADFTDLPVAGDDESNGIEYVAVAAYDTDDFDSDTDRATLWNGRTSTGMTVFINRVVDADRITIDDVQPDDAQVDLDGSIDVDTLTETTDLDADGDYTPFEEAQVDAEVVETNANDIDGVEEGNLQGAVNNVDADENGISEFTFELEPNDAEEVDDIVEFTIEFTPDPRDNEDVVVEQEIAFVPDIGDTGTISGDVDEITDDITVGVEEDRSSNISPAEDVPVHAVQVDDVLDNTVTIEDGLGLGDLPDQVDVDGESYDVATTDAGNIDIADDEQFRVVTFDDGEPFTHDPRSDYLVTVDEGQDIEVVQNETEPGFNIHDAGDTAEHINVHFLRDGDYQAQQLVTVDLEGTEMTAPVWVNATLNEQPDGLDNSGVENTQDSASEQFDAPSDLTFDEVDETFADDRVVPTDYTNANGDFELLNMPTTEEYVVIAGAGDDVSADGTDRMGFANFAGYDIVEVSPNADAGAAQLNTDLSVQQYEPVIDIEYDLDVTVVDELDNVKEANIPQGEERTVEVQVESRQAGTDDGFTPVGEGIDVSASLVANPDDPADVGDLTEDSLVTDGNGVASTTFNAFGAGDGTVNVSATATDDLGQVETDGEEEAKVTVFGAATITGDIVNEDSQNLPGATVRLYEDAQALEDGDYVSQVEAGELGSFTFIENQETGERLQSGQTWTVEAEFEGETETREYTELNTGTNDGDIVIVGVEPEEALFQVQDVEPSGDLELESGAEQTFEATIENVGDEAGADDVEFLLDGETVADATTDEILGGDTDTVELEVTAPEPGEYDWSVETSNDASDTWSLTVTDDNGDEPPATGFTLSDIEPGDAEVEFDQDITASVLVTNNNDEAGETEVTLTATDDELGELELGETTVELDAGASDTVEFDVDLGIAEEILETGDSIDYVFETEDDELSATLTFVEDASEPGEPEPGTVVEFYTDEDGQINDIFGIIEDYQNNEGGFADDADLEGSIFEVIGAWQDQQE